MKSIPFSIVMACSLCTIPALAQQSPTTLSAPIEETKDWQFKFVPYIWLPVVDTTFSFNDSPINVDADSDAASIFDTLDFALLFLGEVRKEKFGFFYDFQYVKLSYEGTVGQTEDRDYDADVTIADATLAPEYRFYQSETFTLDGFVGARLLYADVGFDLDAGAVLPAFSGGENKFWVDPIVGAKGSIRLSDHWGMQGYADIGGFGVGSDLTYQLMGTFSYRFNKTFSMYAGYRLFSVDFDRGDFELDALLHGPIVGFGFSF